MLAYTVKTENGDHQNDSARCGVSAVKNGIIFYALLFKTLKISTLINNSC